MEEIWDEKQNIYIEDGAILSDEFDTALGLIDKGDSEGSPNH